MIQIGEFSYLLAREGVETGAVSEALNTLVLTSSVLTIVLTPAAFAVAPGVQTLLARLPAIGRAFSARPAVWGEEAELRDHVVVIGYGRVGRHLVAGLRRQGTQIVVVEQDMHLVQELRSQGIPAVYGDASYPVVLAAAHPERARLVAVALPDSGATHDAVLTVHRANPEVPVLARMPREEDEDGLIEAGATVTIAPERAGAALMLEEGERLLGTIPDADPVRAEAARSADGRA
jgi:CPA2 family monovalent cation:H+ antiporter-2